MKTCNNVSVSGDLHNSVNPALGTFDAAHLDSGKCIVKLLCDRSHLGHAAGETDFLTMINNLSNRRDNSCGTAKTTLCEVLNLFESNFTLFCFKSEIFFCNLYK